MTFAEADAFHWQILKLIWKNTDRRKPTHYTVSNLGAVQTNILEALGNNQYVALFEAGELKAFASWWRLDDEGLDAAFSGMMPANRAKGKHVFISEATACKGYMKRLVKALRSANRARYASWYRPKNGKEFEGSKYGTR